ncbi:MAG TPA: substrate-binding domain-containing protein, partial [Chthoniobacteraceae bacterium]|nr:substrate-binding domain-containing protein [Chthoniobacteraceae bacterium]
QRGDLDAMIIFPFTPCQPLIDACERHRVPYVTFHPVSPGAVSNYVTPDFFGAGVRIAQAVAAGNRRRVALVTYGEILASSTAWALASGIASGLLDLGRPVHLERTSFRGLREVDQYFGAWLDERKGAIPDAILCHRHDYWRGVKRALEERGLNVPGDVSLITTLQQETMFDSSGATRLILPFSETAETALQTLRTMLEQDTPTLPPTRLDIRFTGGATTLPEENALLGLS